MRSPVATVNGPLVSASSASCDHCGPRCRRITRWYGHLLRAGAHLVRARVLVVEAEDVAGLQRAADQAVAVDAGGAEERLGLDATGDRQVRRGRRCRWAASLSVWPSRTGVVRCGTGSPSTCSVKPRPAAPTTRSRERGEGRAVERGLDQRRAGRVAAQRVGQAGGAGVERAGLRHAVVGLVEAAAVEDEVQRSGLLHAQRRRVGLLGQQDAALRRLRRLALAWPRSGRGRRARTGTGRRGAGRRRSRARCRSRSSRPASAPGRSSPARWRSRPRGRGRRCAGPCGAGRAAARRCSPSSAGRPSRGRRRGSGRRRGAPRSPPGPSPVVSATSSVSMPPYLTPTVMSRGVLEVVVVGSQRVVDPRGRPLVGERAVLPLHVDRPVAGVDLAHALRAGGIERRGQREHAQVGLLVEDRASSAGIDRRAPSSERRDRDALALERGADRLRGRDAAGVVAVDAQRAGGELDDACRRAPRRCRPWPSGPHAAAAARASWMIAPSVPRLARLPSGAYPRSGKPSATTGWPSRCAAWCSFEPAIAMIGSAGSNALVASTIASAWASEVSATAVLSAPWGFMWCSSALGGAHEGVHGADLVERVGVDVAPASASSARRPKPTRSGRPGCAPTATSASSASRRLVRIVPGSPAWKPQARLALDTCGEQRRVVAHPPGAERLAGVDVEIDAVGRHAPQPSMW